MAAATMAEKATLDRRPETNVPTEADNGRVRSVFKGKPPRVGEAPVG